MRCANMRKRNSAMASDHDFTVTWFDHGREPQCEPNPAYPDGIDLDARTPEEKRKPACKVDLPYPAKRCGLYLVVCERCHTSAGITTAGRPDDPRSVMIPCKLN